MKKVKNILTLIALSLIIVISGCGSKMKTAPWSEKDLEKMEQEKQEKVPIVRWEF
jgi:uncharacterized lipoprotein YehR (DUF1307 family)